MKKNTRRDPLKPGLAGLTEEDRNKWQCGAVTLADIAGRLGVSAPAVSKEFRRRGWRRKSEPSTRPELTGQGGIPPGTALTSEEIAGLLQDSAIGLLVLLHREMKRMATDERSFLGPAALKAFAASLAGLRNELVATGIISEADQTALLPLVVRALTPEESAEIREEAERAYGETPGLAGHP